MSTKHIVTVAGGDANGYVYSDRSVTIATNKAFWNLASLCCYDSDFKGE